MTAAADPLIDIAWRAILDPANHTRGSKPWKERLAGTMQSSMTIRQKHPAALIR
jgi:hypothetical protein